ncbi:MAG: SDR family oxidoreductase [Halieaceae bacterium]|jgi:3-oxoacyl-[acyl-carrier protein] reductase|nr:SDR family oxidoreductase [Halieaceae bacterium]
MATATTNFDFSGCHVLVTGGTSGIGYGIADAFQRAGASVMITGTRGSPADYDEVDLSRFEYHPLQMQDKEAIFALGKAISKLDFLVNNAGANLLFAEGGEWAPENFAESIEINLLSGFHMTSAVIDKLMQSEVTSGACVINMGSLTSFFGNELTPAYGAAKAGNRMLSMSQAHKWASNNIRVNAVAPGLIATRMTAPMLDMPELTEAMMARTPLSRWGLPADVAGATLFLCSDQASWITGQTIIIDGGYSTMG